MFEAVAPVDSSSSSEGGGGGSRRQGYVHSWEVAGKRTLTEEMEHHTTGVQLEMECVDAATI